MKTLLINCDGFECGILTEIEPGGRYQFVYHPDYKGSAISLTMPVRLQAYDFETFPPFFDGLLPEGLQLESLLRTYKIDQSDYMTQLLIVGSDLVGAVTITSGEAP